MVEREHARGRPRRELESGAGVEPGSRLADARELVRAIKGGRAPTRLLPGLMLNDESRVSKNEMTKILEGRAALPLVEP